MNVIIKTCLSRHRLKLIKYTSLSLRCDLFVYIVKTVKHRKQRFSNRTFSRIILTRNDRDTINFYRGILHFSNIFQYQLHIFLLI